MFRNCVPTKKREWLLGSNHATQNAAVKEKKLHKLLINALCFVVVVLCSYKKAKQTRKNTL